MNLTKLDKETGEPQGDATLAGAVYGIYDGDTLIDTYTTDAEGKFTTKYYICGDNWTVREITPSEGYLLGNQHYLPISLYILRVVARKPLHLLSGAVLVARLSGRG